MPKENLNARLIMDCLPKLLLLKKNHYHLAQECFDVNYPNISFIKSVIERKIPGTILIDSYNQPQAAIVLTTSSFGFASKNFNYSDIKAIYQALLAKRINNISDFKLMFDSSIVALPSCTSNITLIDRLHLSLKKEKMNSEAIPSAPLEGFILQPVDRLQFEHCHWKELMRHIYGTRENYLANGAGYCLIYQGNVVCEAHAVLSNEFAELGVVTHPSFRNRGLSVLVCQALLSHCVNKQFLPKWSCDATNEASYKLAIKLGFENPVAYKALAVCKT